VARSRRDTARPERPADDTRERIIDAARAIFARDGFSGAKMQTIADRVGIQRPSLFYHFKNKEALFVAAHEQVFARIERLFRESLVPHGDPFVQLDRLSRAVLAVTAEEPDFARMVARTAVDRHPSAVAVVRNYVRPLVALSVEFVRSEQRRGVFRDDIDPFFFTFNSWGAVLLYFTARDLLALDSTPGSTKNTHKDLQRFTRTLLQMGNRALAVQRRQRPAARVAT
jgi:TetR/AcrR family transcriptional regulator